MVETSNNTTQAPKSGAKPPKSTPPKAAGASDNALNAVVTRNAYYKDGYRSLVRIAILQTIIIVGLIVALIMFIGFSEPKNRYFATTEDGRLVPMVPLSEPNLSHPALVSWTAQSVTEVMTFGFHDYRARLQESSRHFTRRGWESFTGALKESGMIDAVSQNRQVVTAVPRSAPIIRAEGLRNGRYQWEVEIPIVINFQLGATSRTSPQVIRLVIVRVPRLESPSGIGIEQWIAGPG